MYFVAVKKCLHSLIKTALFLFFLTCLNGCQSSQKEKKKSLLEKPESICIDQTRYLKLGLHSAIRSFNPRICIDSPSFFIAKMLFEGLTRFGPDGVIQLATAESVEISKDQKTYLFHLRPTYWTNGDLVTAYDFFESWKKVVSPIKGESIGACNFYDIKNVQAIVKGEKPIESLGVMAIDAKTLKVELEHPTPYFLEAITTPPFFPVNHRVEQKNPDWMNQQGGELVCNGPFRLKSYHLEHELFLEKNPIYWDKEAVILPGIHLQIIKNPSALVHLFEKQQLDWVGKPFSTLPLDAIPSLKQARLLRISRPIGLYWYFLNTEAAPFQNKKIRKALAYAINRKEITTHVLQGGEIPALRVLPPPVHTQESPFFFDADIPKAQALFNEGLTELHLSKEEFPPLTINYPNTPPHLLVAETIQQQWKKALGIEIKLETQDWPSHYNKIQRRQFQIGVMGWFSWLRDPIYIMQTFRNKGDGINMCQWENEIYQTLLNATEQEINQNKRKELFHKAELLLLEEMPVIPLYLMTCLYLQSPDLKRVCLLGELNDVDFKWAYFLAPKKQKEKPILSIP